MVHQSEKIENRWYRLICVRVTTAILSSPAIVTSSSDAAFIITCFLCRRRRYDHKLLLLTLSSSERRINVGLSGYVGGLSKEGRGIYVADVLQAAEESLRRTRGTFPQSCCR